MQESNQINNFEIEELDARSIKEKVKDFSDLLRQIQSLSDKKRQLWSEIYQNAISDRRLSYTMFAKLVAITQDKSTEHAIHGRSLSAYIERMSRANDQLLKLAELIAKELEDDSKINEDDLYAQIRKH